MPLPAPEDFDVASWLGGVRPTRRAVRLYGRADVLGRMEEIAGMVELVDDPGELLDEFDALKDAFEASSRWFVVEARSAEWVEDFRRVARQRYGLGKRDTITERHQVAILLAQLAEQIVSPTGVTPEHLERLHETNAGELNKLVVAMTMANEHVAESAKVLALDFSSRRAVRDPG